MEIGKENMGIQEIHKKVFECYKRTTNRTFYLRKRNTKEKLDKGYWFQGNEDYVFTSPFKPADNDNKTQKIGFVVLLNKSCRFDFVYKNFSSEDESYKGFYEEVLKYYKIPPSVDFNICYKKEIIFESTQNWSTELEKYLSKDVPEIIKIAKKHEVPDDYLFFSKNEFNNRINKIEQIISASMSDASIPTLGVAPLNQILYGPPGTGKTYSTVSRALGILGVTEDQKQDIKSIGELKEVFKSRVEFVTFHQSFSYEDFVEGLKAKTDDGKLSYEVEGGIFKEICGEAKAKSDKTHVLIIDEINRGNISRIFGELITLIEPSKRAGESEVISVKLPYSKEDFSVPNNLYIIGTMNTADRSLTMIDTALRRRFDFIEMAPDVGLVKGDFDGIKVGKILEFINKRIEILYDREHLIGHSFLMGIDDLRGLRNAFKNKILPLLEEYFYDDFENIRKVLNDKEEKFYEETKVDGSLFFGNENIQKDSYKKVNIDELTAEYFQQIYKNKDE